MFLMYFIIALLNTVLTIKKREFEKKALEKEGEENLVKLYNTLLNSLSHELRKPIATIKIATHALQNKTKLSDEKYKADLISDISVASSRLNRNVENLLNSSRLESGTLKETVHLSEMYQNWFLDYASYVILERAVPEITDGLKPVQRRILHAFFHPDRLGGYIRFPTQGQWPDGVA